MATTVKASKTFQEKKVPSVPLKLRIGRDSKRRFAEPVYSANGKLKAFWCRISGNEERHPEGVYYLRVKGKKWVNVGKDAEFARTKQLQVSAALSANEVGVEMVDPDLTSAALVSGTPLVTAVKNYLENVKKLKSHKTWCAYRRANELFAQHLKR